MTTGRFIAFEGIEGSGKSTQIARLAGALAARGVEVVRLREPGGTGLGDRIRAILLDAGEVGMRPEAEMYLFAASRAQLVQTAVEPALARGAWVLCDRFVYSSLAYQGHARGLGRDRVLRANADAATRLPDLVVLMDLPVAASLARAAARGSLDRFEQEGAEFHEAVRRGFLAERDQDPDRFATVAADDAEEAVTASVLAAVLPLLDAAP